MTRQTVAAQMRKWREFVASEPDYSSLASAQSVGNHGLNAPYVSQAAAPYLQAVLHTARIHWMSPGQLRTALASIEQETMAQLPDPRDRELVLVASSIALSSGQYWNRHRNEWEALCGRNPGACGSGLAYSSTAGQAALALSAGDGLSAAAAASCGWGVLGGDIVGGIVGGLFGALVVSTYVAIITC